MPETVPGQKLWSVYRKLDLTGNERHYVIIGIIMLFDPLRRGVRLILVHLLSVPRLYQCKISLAKRISHNCRGKSRIPAVALHIVCACHCSEDFQDYRISSLRYSQIQYIQIVESGRISCFGWGYHVEQTSNISIYLCNLLA